MLQYNFTNVIIFHCTHKIFMHMNIPQCYVYYVCMYKFVPWSSYDLLTIERTTVRAGHLDPLWNPHMSMGPSHIGPVNRHVGLQVEFPKTHESLTGEMFFAFKKNETNGHDSWSLVMMSISYSIYIENIKTQIKKRWTGQPAVWTGQGLAHELPVLARESAILGPWSCIVDEACPELTV